MYLLTPLRSLRALLPTAPAAAVVLAGCAATQTQHYEDGRVVFDSRPTPPSLEYTLTGKMDVTTGRSFVKVVAKRGTYLIQPDQLVYVGPNFAAPQSPPALPPADQTDQADKVEIPNALQGVTTTRSLLDQRLVETKGEPIPATLFYAGSDREYDYYYLAHPSGNQMYRVPQNANAQAHRIPCTSDVQKWQRLQTS